LDLDLRPSGYKVACQPYSNLKLLVFVDISMLCSNAKTIPHLKCLILLNRSVLSVHIWISQIKLAAEVLPKFS